MKYLATLALLLSTTAFGKNLYVVVTPAWDESAFQCQIRPDQIPPVIENDLIKFRVTVKGGTGPFQWRLPLYKKRNGSNDVALARVGEVSLDDQKSFYIDLNVQDLERMDRKNLEVQLRSRERYEARCSTPADGVRSLAAKSPPKEFNMIQGSLVPSK